MGALQALLRAARCLPRDVTLLEDVQQVWNSEDCQASLSQLAALEPERVAVCSIASRNLLFISISNRDPENIPEYSEFLHLYGNRWFAATPLRTNLQARPS